MKKRILFPVLIVLAVLLIGLLVFTMIRCSKKSTDNNESTPAQEPDMTPGSLINGELKTGNVVRFGSYEQDNDEANGKETVEWIVIAESDGKALLLSRYALDCHPYNDGFSQTDWGSCTLRAWLNSDFYDAAFCDAEKRQILSETLVNADNPEYGTKGGPDTADRVFILSLEDAVNAGYGFASDPAENDTTRQCKPTAYALAKKCLTGDDYISGFDDNCRWWLRTPGFDSDVALVVSVAGTVKISGGFSVSGSVIAVRPAIWVASK